MKWEMEYAARREKAEFESKLLAHILAKYQPLEAWKLVGGEVPEDDLDDLDDEAREHRTHQAVEELGTDEGFDVEDVDRIQDILKQFDIQGYAVEEV